MSTANDVVIGSGVLGRTIARMLRQQGRAVTVLNRHGGSLDGHALLACDLTQAGELERHLGDRSRIFVCAAPAYFRWKEEFGPLIDGLRRAAKGRAADIVYADNLYAYGARDEPLTEAMPYAAATVKGRIRADAAERLMRLHGSYGVRVAIVRAADFFGPGVENSVVGLRVIRDVLAGRPAYVIGNPDLPHALTYLPDQARCMIALASEDDAFGSSWHAPNNPALSLRAFLEQVAQQGASPLKLRSAGRLMLRAMGMFNPAMRELIEMLYQFEKPFLVSHEKIGARFGLAPTPLPTALAETAQWVRSQP
ncbi:MAG TPA: NAD-dependent epimerase/dehydratase family protein [Albitalea sp.]|nr:NAD-dependent epimerase/dehydratase family protein [Albitalea sp.]